MPIRESVFASPPPILFRYMGHTSADFLKDPALRFTSPAEFNDPFECFPKVEFSGASKAREFLKEHNRLSKDMTQREVSAAVARMLQTDVSQEFSVLCLSEVPDSILMWGHYARSHEGCVLGFDSDLINAFRGSETPHRSGKVLYAQQKPVLPYPQHDVFEENLGVLFTKSLTWEYEKEWRVVLKRRRPPTQSALEFNCPPECLQWVIVGCRAEQQQWRSKYLRALRQNKALSHVRVFDAVRHESEFRLLLKNSSGRLVDWEKEMLRYSDQKAKSPKRSWIEAPLEERQRRLLRRTTQADSQVVR